MIHAHIAKNNRCHVVSLSPSKHFIFNIHLKIQLSPSYTVKRWLHNPLPFGMVDIKHSWNYKRGVEIYRSATLYRCKGDVRKSPRIKQIFLKASQSFAWTRSCYFRNGLWWSNKFRVSVKLCIFSFSKSAVFLFGWMGNRVFWLFHLEPCSLGQHRYWKSFSYKGLCDLPRIWILLAGVTKEIEC